MSAGAEPRESVSERDEAVAVRLDPGLVKRLSRRSLWRTLAFIGFQWITIALCVSVAEISSSYIVLLLCLFVIATRQHALAVMVHEGCHFNLCKSRPLNDFLANVFCAFPLSISVRRYRNSHLEHHRLLNLDSDPDIEENTPPSSLRALLGLLLVDLCFLSIPKNMKRARKFGVFGIFKEQGPGWRTERYLYLAFLATLIASATFLGVWKQVALLWFVPQFSLFQAITRLRGYSEHAGRFDEASDLNKTLNCRRQSHRKFHFRAGEHKSPPRASSLSFRAFFQSGQAARGVDRKDERGQCLAANPRLSAAERREPHRVRRTLHTKNAPRRCCGMRGMAD